MLIFAVPSPTTVPMLGTGGGANVWTVVGAVGSIVAAGTGVYLVYALRRTHAHCGFGDASWTGAGGDRGEIVIPFFVTPGGPSVVRRKYKVHFTSVGSELAFVERCGIPVYSDRAWDNRLRYEMDNPHAPISVDIRVKFKHGGRGKLKTTLTPTT